MSWCHDVMMNHEEWKKLWCQPNKSKVPGKEKSNVSISGVENKRHWAYNDLWTLLWPELDWK